MRIDFTLKVDKAALENGGQGVLIPINYQYALAKEFYKRILEVSPSFASLVRDKGARNGYKGFKLFTFSRLTGEGISLANVNGKKMLRLNCERVYLTVSMVSDTLYEIFGLAHRMDHSLKIGKTRFECNFWGMPEPRIGRHLRLKTLSPIVISRKVYRKGALPKKFQEVYMGPDDKDYFEYLRSNIEEKFIAWKSARKEPVYAVTERMRRRGTIRSFRVLGKPKPSLTTLREGRRDEVKVRGWSYEFEMEGDPEILEFAYMAGIGKMNSMGFGCVSI